MKLLAGIYHLTKSNIYHALVDTKVDKQSQPKTSEGEVQKQQEQWPAVAVLWNQTVAPSYMRSKG